MTSRTWQKVVLSAAFVFVVTVGAFLLYPRQRSPQYQGANTLVIAAASDMNPALDDLVSHFRLVHRDLNVTEVRVTYGSSGSLFAQISNGAPYDVFLSADKEYPKRLVPAHALSDPKTYAYGRLALWVREDSDLDPEGMREALFKDSRLRKLAIANPAHAPYGRAAQNALLHYQVLELLKKKLAIAENVAQAAQFAESGTADAGLIALSLAKSRQMSAGGFWVLPKESHPPIEQTAVIMTRAKHNPAAIAFVSYLNSPGAATILQQYGFIIP